MRCKGALVPEKFGGVNPEGFGYLEDGRKPGLYVVAFYPHDLARREPGETPAFYEQEEELAAALALEAALTNARTFLEDANEDDSRLADKWATIDALAHAANDAHEEVVRLRGELGVS